MSRAADLAGTPADTDNACSLQQTSACADHSAMNPCSSTANFDCHDSLARKIVDRG